MEIHRDLQKQVAQAIAEGLLLDQTAERLLRYLEAIAVPPEKEVVEQYLTTFLRFAKEDWLFAPALPMLPDMQQMTFRFLSPQVAWEKSSCSDFSPLETLRKEGANVFLLCNHQTEIDPLLVMMAAHYFHGVDLKDLLAIAGHKVRQDPFAKPFIRACHVIPIFAKVYSKEAKEREKMVLYNQRSMKRLGSLLAEGGKIIFVAPAGQRDRKNAEGVIEIAPFDPKNVQLMQLIAKKAKRPAYFYPVTLSTWNLLPPPRTLSADIEEERILSYTPIHISLGNALSAQ